MDIPFALQTAVDLPVAFRAAVDLSDRCEPHSSVEDFPRHRGPPHHRTCRLGPTPPAEDLSRHRGPPPLPYVPLWTCPVRRRPPEPRWTSPVAVRAAVDLSDLARPSKT